jgi:small multidrug resistance family-3 protein
MDIARSLFLFVLAGLCEIGGGYLMWLWMRDNRGIWFAVLGALVLILYGIIPTFQPANFGRVYAGLRRHFHSPINIMGLADR